MLYDQQTGALHVVNGQNHLFGIFTYCKIQKYKKKEKGFFVIPPAKAIHITLFASLKLSKRAWAHVVWDAGFIAGLF